MHSLSSGAALQTQSAAAHKGVILTLNLLTTTIVSPTSNASKWQMGFNSAFKGLNIPKHECHEHKRHCADKVKPE